MQARKQKEVLCGASDATPMSMRSENSGFFEDRRLKPQRMQKINKELSASGPKAHHVPLKADTKQLASIAKRSTNKQGDLRRSNSGIFAKVDSNSGHMTIPGDDYGSEISWGQFFEVVPSENDLTTKDTDRQQSPSADSDDTVVYAPPEKTVSPNTFENSSDSSGDEMFDMEL